jgi:hypothetical protein
MAPNWIFMGFYFLTSTRNYPLVTVVQNVCFPSVSTPDDSLVRKLFNKHEILNQIVTV